MGGRLSSKLGISSDSGIVFVHSLVGDQEFSIEVHMVIAGQSNCIKVSSSH